MESGVMNDTLKNFVLAVYNQITPIPLGVILSIKQFPVVHWLALP